MLGVVHRKLLELQDGYFGVMGISLGNNVLAMKDAKAKRERGQGDNTGEIARFLRINSS